MNAKKSLALLFAALLFAAADNRAPADTFGSGPDSFDIEFVAIGNPGNTADTTGIPNPAGSVAYSYRMGKFEISEQMVAKANVLGGLGISTPGFGSGKPATTVSWFGAAKFANWLNMSTGNTPAYKFDSEGDFQLWQLGDTGYDPNNRFRNSRARYFLPSADEWYKAAYYDPISGVYYDYPTGSDSVPDGIDFEGDPNFDAVFLDGGSNPLPNDITNVGVLSPYGTAGQGGNIWEWEETEADLLNDSTSSDRGYRSGDWNSNSFIFAIDLASWVRYGANPTDQAFTLGFRVASVVPEPSAVALCAIACLGVLVRRRLL